MTEIFQMTPAALKLIMGNATAQEMKDLARKEGMRSLRESAIDKAVKGETSLEEVFRRAEELRSGKVKTIPGEEVWKQVDELLASRRHTDVGASVFGQNPTSLVSVKLSMLAIELSLKFDHTFDCPSRLVQPRKNGIYPLGATSPLCHGGLPFKSRDEYLA